MEEQLSRHVALYGGASLSRSRLSNAGLNLAWFVPEDNWPPALAQFWASPAPAPVPAPRPDPVPAPAPAPDGPKPDKGSDGNNPTYSKQIPVENSTESTKSQNEGKAKKLNVNTKVHSNTPGGGPFATPAQKAAAAALAGMVASPPFGSFIAKFFGDAPGPVKCTCKDGVTYDIYVAADVEKAVAAGKALQGRASPMEQAKAAAALKDKAAYTFMISECKYATIYIAGAYGAALAGGFGARICLHEALHALLLMMEAWGGFFDNDKSNHPLIAPKGVYHQEHPDEFKDYLNEPQAELTVWKMLSDLQASDPKKVKPEVKTLLGNVKDKKSFGAGPTGDERRKKFITKLYSGLKDNVGGLSTPAEKAALNTWLKGMKAEAKTAYGLDLP